MPPAWRMNGAYLYRRTLRFCFSFLRPLLCRLIIVLLVRSWYSLNRRSPMLTPVLSSDSPLPLYEQIYRPIRQEIQSGRLPAGERLPSKRSLAAHLEVSVVTVEGAYSQLLAEGYLRSEPKRGYLFAARSPPSPMIAPPRPLPPPPRRRKRSAPSTTTSPPAAWIPPASPSPPGPSSCGRSSAWRTALSSPPCPPRGSRS